MSILSSFFQSLAYPYYLLIHFYMYVIFAAIILSWLEAFNILNNYSSAVNMIKDTIRRLTEPYFAFFRRFIPPVGMLDLSSLIALFVLYFLQNFIPNFLLQLARMTA